MDLNQTTNERSERRGRGSESPHRLAFGKSAPSYASSFSHIDPLLLVTLDRPERFGDVLSPLARVLEFPFDCRQVSSERRFGLIDRSFEGVQISIAALSVLLDGLDLGFESVDPFDLRFDLVVDFCNLLVECFNLVQ